MGDLHGEEAQIAGHGDDKQRDGENQADDQVALLLVDFFLAGQRLGVFRVAARFEHFKPGGGDCAAQIGLADQGGDIANLSAFGGVADLRLAHAFHRGEGFFQAAGVVVVAHALDDQIGFAFGDPVPGALHAADQIIQGGSQRIKFDGRPFGGKVDRRALHAVHLFQVAFHGCRAVGAGHAGNGKGD